MISQPKEINTFKNNSQPNSNDKKKLEDTKPNSFISNDSTNEIINQNKKKKKYIFENNNKSYSIILILFEDKIKIIVNPLTYGIDEYYYEKDFSQEELKNNNKVFKLCNDIEESFDYFNDLFQDKQNQLLVNESDDFFKIEKKLQLSLPLKIEVTKKYKDNKINFNQNNSINNNNIKNDNKINIDINNDIKNISPILNKNNNEINERMNLLEQENSQLYELIKKKYLQNEERINKLSENLSIVDNVVNSFNVKEIKEDKKQIGDLLHKKRTNISDLSDISFNSNSNDNEIITKKNKSLEKEKFLKIFSDNNLNSDDSKEKFFMKILKKKKLKEENNLSEKNKNNNNNNINKNDNEKINDINNIKNINYKKDGDENETYLYGDQDSSDEIKDDIDFFSNNSPSITAVGMKHNNNNEYLSFRLNNDKSKILNDNKFPNGPSLFYKNSNNNKNSLSNNYNNCIINMQNIHIKDQNEKNLKYNNINGKIKNDIGSDWTINNSYNMIGSLIENDNNFRKNDEKTIYKIMHENSVKSCNIQKSYDCKDKNQYSNNIFSIDSKIISNYVELDFIIDYLKNEFNKEISNSIRIYRATEDGDKADDFHRLCDGNTNIIVLIKTKDGKKFGGYTSIGFNNYNQSYLDDTAFIFSIDKREIYPNIKGKNAIESYYNLGPTFSGDSIKIYDNFLKKGGITSKIGTNYQTNEDFQINDGKKIFAVDEIEVLEFLEMKIDNNI